MKERLSVNEIRSLLTDISSNENNKNHFINLGESGEIALIPTSSELYSKFMEDSIGVKALYLSGEHKKWVIDAMVHNYNKEIEEKIKTIKDGL